MSKKEELRQLLKITKTENISYKVLNEIICDNHVRQTVLYTVNKQDIEAYILKPLKRGVYPRIIAIHQDGDKRPYKFEKSEVAGLGEELNEFMVALDILSSIPEVDSNKIGGIGHSAGGLLVAYLMYLDERFKVACSSYGIASTRDFFPEDGIRLMQWLGTLTAVPNINNWGDISDILVGLAPRAFMEVSSDVDKSDYFKNAIKNIVLLI